MKDWLDMMLLLLLPSVTVLEIEGTTTAESVCPSVCLSACKPQGCVSLLQVSLIWCPTPTTCKHPPMCSELTCIHCAAPPRRSAWPGRAWGGHHMEPNVSGVLGVTVSRGQRGGRSFSGAPAKGSDGRMGGLGWKCGGVGWRVKGESEGWRMRDEGEWRMKEEDEGWRGEG